MKRRSITPRTRRCSREAIRMGENVIAEIKRDHIIQLVKDGKRPDGRGFEEYRPMSVETNIISQAEGSARVKLGGTDVFCGIKMQIGTPYPDSPNVGTMATAAELIPMASPTFELGPPQPPAIELSRVVDRGIRESGTVNMEKLCIEEGEKVWVMFMDFHIVDYDGNLFDACSLAGLAALLTAKVPAAKNDLGDDYPLPVEHHPVMTTAMKIGDGIVFDPGLEEDQVGKPRLSVSFDENGDLCAMQKGLEGGFTIEEIKQIVATGKKKSQELRDELFKQIGFTPEK
jgi:exosome complex component RRP42